MKSSIDLASAARVVLVCSMASVCACSSTGVASPGPTPPVGSVTPEDSGALPAEAGPSDAGVDAPIVMVVNGCTTYDDHTADADARTITWIRSVGTTCWKIKKGQSVTWNPKDTDFSAHPLKPMNGTTGSPIQAQPPGTAPYVQMFGKAGTFGFQCGFHFDMTGAIEVVD